MCAMKLDDVHSGLYCTFYAKTELLHHSLPFFRSKFPRVLDLELNGIAEGATGTAASSALLPAWAI